MGEYTPYQVNQSLLELNPYERAIQEYFSAPTKEKRTACEKLISFLGSHPRLLNEGKKMVDAKDPRIQKEDLAYLTPFLPAQPDRDKTIRAYLKQHKSGNRVRRQVTLQRAEETGEIKDMMKREYMERIQFKVSLLLSVSMNFLDVDGDSKKSMDYDVEDQEGFRG